LGRNGDEISGYSSGGVEKVNWRRPVIMTLLRLSGSKIPIRYSWLKRHVRKSEQEICNYEEERLKELLLYAHNHVPYYHKVLSAYEVVKRGRVHLENFESLPLLTKELMRGAQEELKSDELRKRRYYYNTSGGSTAEPVRFIQDKEYWEGDVAATLLFFSMASKDVGEPEIKLWGSERDIIEGTTGWKTKLQNWLYHRTLLNSFMMDECEMERYVCVWNKVKPKVVWSYTDSIYELSRFAERKALKLYPPASVIVTAATLNESIKRYVEKTLQTRILNQYGSREVGAIACECLEQKGLHIFTWRLYVELINGKCRKVDEGEEGEIIITSLENYSMPLIRYRIGDMGIAAKEKCTCGINLRLLQKVTGRITDHFRRIDGGLIHGEYFTHLFYFRPWVKKFQVVQNEYKLIKIYVVKEGEASLEDMNHIARKIKLVMGEDCQVEFEFVDELRPTRSGKYLYTICELDNARA
jgi:phenylacetate-CoA ligase